MKTRFAEGVLIALLLTPVVFPQAAQTPEAMLGAALHHERVTGNLQAAIDGFRKVLAAKGTPRSVAAQAQFHIALCYEKLGHQEARKAFESVVKNYADQKDLAAQASARLAAMAPAATTTVRTRLLWDDAADGGGRTSADGRYYTFVDWATCDLAVRDLVSGESRRLTNGGGCSKVQNLWMASAISHDGKYVAFGVRRPRDPNGVSEANKNGHGDLRVIGLDGTGEKVIATGNNLDYAEAMDWSPDNKWVAAAVVYRSPENRAEEEDTLLLVNVESGEQRRFDTQDKLWPANARISPDGQWLAYSVRPTHAKPKLMIRPVADHRAVESVVADGAEMMGWTPDGTALLFSREGAGSADLYLLPMRNGKAAAPPHHIPGAAMAGAMPAGITRPGALIYSTYNRRSESHVLPWSQNGFAGMTPSVSISAGNSVGALLGGGAAHFSPDGKRLLVVNPAYGITVRELSSKGERSISVNLKSWKVVRWTHDSQAFLVLGVDEQNRSGVFRIDGVTGNPTLVAPVPYNTWSFTVSRDGKTIFHGTPRETQAFDTVAGTSRTLFTIAGGGNYDLRVSHDGSKLAIRGGVYLAVVNLQNRESHVIYKLPPNSAAALWAMDWTSDDTKIAVIARPGGGLEKMELWIFSPEGGEPSKQEIPREYRGLSFSPDGRLVATTSQTQRAQVWALENFLPVAK